VDESSLLLLESGEVFQLAPSASGANSNSLAPKFSLTLAAVAGLIGLSTIAPDLVHLIKEKVFVQFSDEVKKEGSTRFSTEARQTI
jgi:hypothetical protein